MSCKRAVAVERGQAYIARRAREADGAGRRMDMAELKLLADALAAVKAQSDAGAVDAARQRLLEHKRKAEAPRRSGKPQVQPQTPNATPNGKNVLRARQGPGLSGERSLQSVCTEVRQS